MTIRPNFTVAGQRRTLTGLPLFSLAFRSRSPLPVSIQFSGYKYTTTRLFWQEAEARRLAQRSLGSLRDTPSNPLFPIQGRAHWANAPHRRREEGILGGHPPHPPTCCTGPRVNLCAGALDYEVSERPRKARNGFAPFAPFRCHWWSKSSHLRSETLVSKGSLPLNDYPHLAGLWIVPRLIHHRKA